MVIAAAVVANFGASVFYAHTAAKYRDAGRAFFTEAKEANKKINEALTLFNYGARDEAFQIMKELEEKNKRFIAEMDLTAQFKGDHP
jgi:hypothetical protein